MTPTPVVMRAVAIHRIACDAEWRIGAPGAAELVTPVSVPALAPTFPRE